jgi:hypothetical protein
VFIFRLHAFASPRRSEEPVRSFLLSIHHVQHRPFRLRPRLCCLGPLCRTVPLFGFISISTDTVFQLTQSTLVPGNISPGCSAYLNGLDTDDTLSSCLAPLLAAVKDFFPDGSGTASTVSSTLNTLCENTTMCSSSTLSTQLANFQTACSNELQTSPVPGVIALYDSIYFLAPFKDALCAQDDSGDYCTAQPASGNAVAGSDAQYLFETANPSATRRDSDTVYTLNTTTWTNEDVLFIGINPSMDATDLCTACTRNVLTSYINQESNVPYSPGLSSSSIASGQTALYNAIEQTCGSSFLSGAVQAAGGIAGNGPLGSLTHNAASRLGSRDWKVMLASAFLGLVTLI